MKPNLFYPTKPLGINQPFGANAAYYAKFLDPFGNPEKGHPGIDFTASHGLPVYAANAGNCIYLKDAHGGEGIYIYGDGFVTIYWHLIGNTDFHYPPPIPFDNAYHEVSAGDLIGFADNTGAPYESSGDHLHFGLAFIDQNKQITNQNNGYGGCVDPLPYLNGQFAQDIPEDAGYIQNLLNIAKTILGLKVGVTNQ